MFLHVIALSHMLKTAGVPAPCGSCMMPCCCTVLQDLVTQSIPAQTTPPRAPAIVAKQAPVSLQSLNAAHVPFAPLKEKPAAPVKLLPETMQQSPKTRMVSSALAESLDLNCDLQC